MVESELLKMLHRFAASFDRESNKMAKKKKAEWSDEMIRLLGDLTDYEIAKRFGLTSASVGRKRAELGIAKSSKSKTKKIEWTDGMISDMGSLTDHAIAAKYGVRAAEVGKERARRGIEIADRSDAVSDELIDDLRNIHYQPMTDQQIASKHGVSVHKVRSVRKKLGIAAGQSGYRHVMAGISDEDFIRDYLELGNNGVASKYVIDPMTASRHAERLGIRPQAREDQFKPKSYHIYLLNKMTDEDFAQTFKVSKSTVSRLRQKYGTGSYQDTPGSKSVSYDPLSGSTSTQDPPHPEVQGRSTHEEF